MLYTFRINCNLDLIVSGKELLDSLGQKPEKLLDSVSLNDLSELTDTFTYYFNKGSAAERTFNNPDIYRKIVKAAEKLKSKQVQFRLIKF